MKNDNYLKSLLLMLAFLLSATAAAHDFEVDDIYFNIDGTTATVTYKGSSYDDYYNEYSGSVTIPTTVSYGGTTYSVTSIGEFAFWGCKGLTSVTIPNSVTTIGGSAFNSCSNLTTINIPESVTSIGNHAFINCTSLTAINIPNSVTSIGNYVFADCSNLTTINIPNFVTTIGEYAFNRCSSLTNIIIPNSVTSIGEYAFHGCSNLTTINIPNFVTTIGSGAFCDCTSLTTVNIPNSIKRIRNETFLNCSSLTNIIIPNSVTYIGVSAFAGCSSLTNINISNSVTSIGRAAFWGCTSLTTINIPISVTTIDDEAFIYCYHLNEVYCYATTPPICIYDSYNTFSNYSATLHVPAASLAAYFTAPIWSNFENIVGDAIVPTDIAISKDSVDMSLGEQIELIATVTPENSSCKEVAWYSTDTNVATVEDGVVTAVGYGECDIFAYCMGMPVVCHITVANRICLGLQEAMLLPNHMLTLTPSAPAMPAGFTVTSSDPTVAATRVMSGKVQIVGIKEGTTTITVASTDGTAQPATCLVTVYTESGDLNSDGFVNISDVTSLIDYLLGGDESSITTKNADVNGDGNINIADVTLLIDSLLSKTE